MAQSLLIALPLVAAALALIIVKRFGWTDFITPFSALLTFYGALTYLLVFGKKGSWQETVAGWIRNQVFDRLPALLLLCVLLVVFLALEVGLLVKGPHIELRGQVLLDNQPIDRPALVRLPALTEMRTDENGIFTLQLPDNGQSEFTVIAQYGELIGKTKIKRGGHSGFEIELKRQIYTTEEGNFQKTIAILEKGGYLLYQPCLYRYNSNADGFGDECRGA